MNASAICDEVKALAPLYALGALSQQEARFLNEHVESCDVCKSEIEAFESVVEEIAFASAEVESPARTRELLLARVAEDQRPGGDRSVADDQGHQLLSVMAGKGEWEVIEEGIIAKLLSVDEETGYVTSLVKMMPGTRLPRHRHSGLEQFFVLEGDCHVNDQILGPGDYHRALSGSVHETTFTEDGTLFLLVAPSNYEVLDVR
jgi:putative transcriptional regulator